MLQVHKIYSGKKDEDYLTIEGHEDDPTLEVILGKIGEVDEEEQVQKEIAAIRTGEDAIAFFSKNGAQTALKFAYCNRADYGTVKFAPYDLVVVPEGKTNPEYYTVSASGVTFVSPIVSENMSLGDWMHQSLVFRVLTSMTFFKNYFHRKMFRVWNQHVRYNVYRMQRKKLSRNLFMAKPQFSSVLAKVKMVMYDVRSVKVFNIGHSVYNLQEFISTQNSVRTNPTTGAAKEFEQKHDILVGILDRLVAQVQRSTEDPVERVTKIKGKCKSMIQEKQEAIELHRRKKLALADLSLLGEFIRLVDYMLQAMLVQTVLEAANEFRQRLDANVKIFSVNVAFTEESESMVLDPPLPAFDDMLIGLWSGIQSVVNGVPSLSSVRQYETYASMFTHQTVVEILEDNVTYLEYHTAIQSKVVHVMSKCQTTADEAFVSFRRIFTYGAQYPPGSPPKFGTESSDPEELAQEMSLMKSFQEELERFRPHHLIGFIMLDGKGLRGDLVPIPENAINQMKEVYRLITRDKCTIALQLFDSTNKVLDERPTNLQKYAEYVTTFKRISDDSQNMEAIREEVESMYSLLKYYGVKISMDDQIQLDALQTKESDFVHTKMLQANQHIQEQKQLMVEDCQKKSADVEESALAISQELSTGIFVDGDMINSAKEVLDQLDAINEKLDKFSEKTAVFGDYEKLFGVVQEGMNDEEEDASFQFEHMKKCRDVFNEKMKLWETISQWKEFTTGWLVADFLKVDVETMQRNVASIFKVVYQLSKASPNDEVVSMVKKSVEDWKANMGCIMDLGNPAMRPRHWEKIFKSICLPWKGNASVQNITLHLLENNSVFSQKELVGETSALASGEFALEQTLEKITNAWEALPLPLMNYRNQKDLYVLGDLSEAITLLEDHAVTIATMMGSRFVAGIRSMVEVWEKKINVASDIVDEWLQVQRAWMYLENIFCADDIQKQLPQEAAKFKQVDKFWRELFRKIRTTCKMSMDAFGIPNFFNQLKWANETLDSVNKSLEVYLEAKRQTFPRFYFLSNDEILSILSQTRNPRAVQDHITKCYDSIAKLCFTDTNAISGMSDMSGEFVPFSQNVERRNPSNTG
eukprot:GEMP01003414.1.p1 GENE.GEMP01003414.1~~GEMP01003414.1.p1  ORF type:complete len:1220 (+),score=246.03 GEMP01003414.1:382-3660(+)